MSENKTVTRRRAISVPTNTEVPTNANVPKDNKEELPEVSVETTAVDQKEETNTVNSAVQENTNNPDVNVPTTDEEWEKQIEAAKKAKEDTLKKEVAEKPSQEDLVEQEVQRRLAIEKKKIEEAEKQKTNEKAQPSETMSDEKKAEIASKNDVSTFVNISLGDENDFINAFEREMDEDDRPESEKRDNPTAYAAGMAIINQIGQRNNQQRLLTEWIGDIVKRNTEALKGVEKEMRLARITPKIGDGSGPKKLTGATARAAVVSRLKGMFRVQLYNSGFWYILSIYTE